MKNLVRRVVGVVASAFLAVTGVAMITQTAEAATSQIVVYNSRYSCSAITAYNTTARERYNLYPGQYHAITDEGNALVDVDLGGSGCDVDSWFKWDESSSSLGWEAPNHYGTCYNNEDESSNPYSAYYNEVTSYRNFSKLYCNP